MTVAKMVSTHLSKWNFEVQKDSTGELLFDRETSSYLDYESISGREVIRWGIHNKKPKTYVMYV